MICRGVLYSTSYISHRASPPSFMYSLPRISPSASRCFTRSFLSSLPIATRPHLVASSCFIARSKPQLPSARLASSSSTMTDTNQGGDSSKKTYHKKATGNALTTVKNHTKEDDLKLYGSCFWYVILTLPCFANHADVFKPLCPARLDFSRAQEDPLPVH